MFSDGGLEIASRGTRRLDDTPEQELGLMENHPEKYEMNSGIPEM